MTRVPLKFLTLLLIAFSPFSANAENGLIVFDYTQKSLQLYNDSIKTWVNNPHIIKAIQKQNTAHKTLTNEEIIELDKRWVREALTSEPNTFIDTLYNTKASQYLRYKIKASYGFISEIIVMDNKGINVAISDIPSDYWQGDEAKWQETFLKGSNQFYVSPPYFDESSQQIQNQLSFTMSDENRPIGVITVGINTEKLKLLK